MRRVGIFFSFVFSLSDYFCRVLYLEKNSVYAVVCYVISRGRIGAVGPMYIYF